MILRRAMGWAPRKSEDNRLILTRPPVLCTQVASNVGLQPVLPYLTTMVRGITRQGNPSLIRAWANVRMANEPCEDDHASCSRSISATEPHRQDKDLVMKPRFSMLWMIVVAGHTFATQTEVNAEMRPNVLWITSEDNGPHIGAFGDDYADTPHLDGLAQQGLIYTNCWSTAPVCAPIACWSFSIQRCCPKTSESQLRCRLVGCERSLKTWIRL